MTDPLGLAASTAKNISSTVTSGYKRARDERRQVYRRFQEAVIAYVMQVRDSRISPEAMGMKPNERKPYIDALMKATTELAQALYEVRLVGNPGAAAAAESVLQSINGSFHAAATRRENLTAEEAQSYAWAMQAFTEACRRDLQYRPPWWQVWRANWWRTHIRRAKKVQSSQASEKLNSHKAPPQDPMASDVVFGLADKVIGPVRNCYSIHVVGNVLQTIDPTGVHFFSVPADEKPFEEDCD
ncbi:hypothetical protein ILP97_43325 [Amycolatopsis sp. H6(2020)]|nr:hypothetical protein [Amycolatopsis sp. H6(2020)]